MADLEFSSVNCYCQKKKKDQITEIYSYSNNKYITLGTYNIAAMDLSYCNKSLPVTEKESLKIKELSDFKEILCAHLLMNEFNNESWRFFSGHLTLTPLIYVALFNQ